MAAPTFEQITLQGSDTLKFLQGQLTSDIAKASLQYQPSAIANLKGRIQFGLWVKKHRDWEDADEDKAVDLVISSDCMAELHAHLKKYGAFSKFTVSTPIPVYPCTRGDGDDVNPTFSLSKDRHDVWGWMAVSIAQGNYWIVEQTQSMFQPQELRLHQQGGVAYDKGCYLGQEVIARIYFRSAPKAYLHRIRGTGATPMPGDSLGDAGKIKVVNAIPIDSSISEFEALVVASLDQLQSEADLRILELPTALQGSVARQT